MWDALSAMLPYAVGLIVSPVPVAAVIMFLVSADGARKATVFELSWLAVSFLVVSGVAALVGQSPPRTREATPAWESVLVIALAVLLLVLALIVALAWRRQQRQGGNIPAPAWMRAIDGLSPGKTAGLAGVLIVANPVNLSMLLAAGIELGHHRHSPAPDLLAAAVFTLVGSLTMLVPWLVTLLSRRGAGYLPQARRWLLRHNNALTFWMTLAFGLLFLYRGLAALG